MSTPSSSSSTSSVPAPASVQLAALAATLNSPAPVSANVTKGVVTAISLTGTPPSLTATLNGDTTSPVAGIVFLDSYTPNVGDTVLIVKQANSVFALGQLNDAVNGTSVNGWKTPSLNSGVTSHSGAPIQYRIVVDNGDNAVQFKGAMDLSGHPTALFTLPAPYAPSAPRNFIVYRDDGGNACQWAAISVSTGGVVSLIQVYGETSTSSTTGGHTHGGGSYQTSGNTTNNSGHTHSYTAGLGGQSDNQGNHGHTVPLSGTAPTFLCFDDKSFFTAT